MTKKTTKTAQTTETTSFAAAAFDPTSKEARAAREGVTHPDGTPYVAYQYDAGGNIALHVRIALATNRPLLLTGPPGAGKSTLARDVALCLGRKYYERVITSRTQARDLLWRWDAIGRLADAQGEKKWLDRPNRFVEPEPLWWATAPARAKRRGLREPAIGLPEPTDPWWAFKRGGKDVRLDGGTVLLLDEIDKADPDVPNDLLGALGERRFVIDETRDEVEREKIACLVFITSNGERDLPQAFLRRCVTLDLTIPTGDAMKAIARSHVHGVDEGVLDLLVRRHSVLLDHAVVEKTRPPGTAELIDAVRAATQILPPDALPEARVRLLENILQATVWKRKDPMPETPHPKPTGAGAQ